MAQPATFLTPEALARKGEMSEWQTFPEPVDRGIVRRFAIAIMDQSAEYRDEKAAKEAGYADIVAPPTYIVRTPPAQWGGEDSLPTAAPNPVQVPGVRKAVLGGMEIDLFRPVQVGDLISYRTRMSDIYEKQGEKGPMAVTVQETVYVNQNRELLAIARKTLILLP